MDTAESVQIGDRVSFRISDVFLASQGDDFLSCQAGSNEMEGVIVDFSDSGAKPRAFAVVRLIRGETLVVPVERLTIWKRGETQDEASGARGST